MAGEVSLHERERRDGLPLFLCTIRALQYSGVPRRSEILWLLIFYASSDHRGYTVAILELESNSVKENVAPIIRACMCILKQCLAVLTKALVRFDQEQCESISGSLSLEVCVSQLGH